RGRRRTSGQTLPGPLPISCPGNRGPLSGGRARLLRCRWHDDFEGNRVAAAGGSAEVNAIRLFCTQPSTGYNHTMAGTEKYLRPEVIRQVARLDLRAKFIVEGFLAGLHASPFHGFSVEFSEHRKYVPGDDLKDLDWTVLGRTDKYYLKKF